MRDKRGRTVDYLRLSVTDRCNLRCRYCMPPEGVCDLGHEAILRFDEIVRLVRIMAADGIKKIKITGGEPLVRRGLTELISELYALPGVEEVTLTTNGVLLAEKLPALCKAGVNKINISLDTLDRRRYAELTGFDELAAVKEAIAACLSRGVALKINALALADSRQGDFLQLARLAEEEALDVRFIEVMPIGMGRSEKGVSADELLKLFESAFGPARPAAEKRGNGPAEYFDFAGFRGKIGFISPLSHRFCAQCNRLRLTADGFLKPCLAAETGLDLKALLRSGAADGQLAAAIERTLAEKPDGHDFCVLQGGRLMSQIGG